MAQLAHETRGGRPSASGLAERRPATARDPWFDNVKVVAVVLVVCGHFLEPLQGKSDLLVAGHLWLYAFHVPAFVLVSGYFSRGFQPTTAKVRGLVERLVLPYVAFEVLYALFRRVVEDEPIRLTLAEPWWLTWFLLCLVIWRFTAPVWGVLRYPVLTSVVISCAAGLTPLPDELESGRLLQMLPFFVLGTRVQQRHLDLLRRPVARICGALFLAASLAVAVVITPEVPSRWTLMTTDYEGLGVGPVEGVLLHLLQLAVEVLLVASFLAVVPRSSVGVSGLAIGTMYAYLLHGFLVRGAMAGGFFDLPFVATGVGVALLTVATAAVALLLMSGPVRAAFRPLVEPQVGWFFRRPGVESPAQPRSD